MTDLKRPLADRTMVVSGGTRGIGLAIGIGDDPMWDIFVDES